MNQARLPLSSPQPGRIRPVECERRTRQHPAASGSARYVGRVGALAVALGVGAAVLSMPAVAYADTTGSSGSAGSGAENGADSSVPKTRSDSGVLRRGSRGPVDSTVDGEESDNHGSSSSRGRGSVDTETSPGTSPGTSRGTSRGTLSSEAVPAPRAADAVATTPQVADQDQSRRGPRGQAAPDAPTADVPVGVTETDTAAREIAPGSSGPEPDRKSVV